MADYRPSAPDPNTGIAPKAPQGQVNTGNNYLVKQAKKNTSPKSGMPVMTTADAVRQAASAALPQQQQTVAGMAQMRANLGAQTQQQQLMGQAQTNMGGGLLQQAGRVYGEV